MRYKRLVDTLLCLRFNSDPHKTHPEETTLHHSSQAFSIARKESNDVELYVAALMHDLGKVIETKGHEKLSVDILESFGYYNEKVTWLISQHMRIRGFLSGRIKRQGKIDEILSNPWLPELIHLRRCDAVARKVGIKVNLDVNLINKLLEKTNEKFKSW